MTKEQAYQIIDKALSMMNLTRADHEMLIKALKVVADKGEEE